jgi:hypothetical protein
MAESSKSLHTFHGGYWRSCWITFPSHVRGHISRSNRWTSTSESRWIVRCDWDCPKRLVHNDYGSRILLKSFLSSTTQNSIVPAIVYALFFYWCLCCGNFTITALFMNFRPPGALFYACCVMQFDSRHVQKRFLCLVSRCFIRWCFSATLLTTALEFW